MRRLTSPALAPLALLSLAACGGGGDGGGGIALQTLSGRVTQPGSSSSAPGLPTGAPISGVSVSFDGRTTTTDPNGVFVFSQTGKVPVGSNRVEVLGSTAPGFDQFPDLEFEVQVEGGQLNAFVPQDLSLPNFSQGGSDYTQANLGLSGALAAALSLEASPLRVALAAPEGTLLGGDAELAPGLVDVWISFLEGEDFTTAPPAGQLMPSGVLVGPKDLEFQTPAGGGLDLWLPNDLGLALDAEVDVWAVDPTTGEWTNLSSATGIPGVVVDDLNGGLLIQALDIAEWSTLYAAAVPTDQECTTTLAGRLVDASAQPLAGLAVQTAFGQTDFTDLQGNFVIEDVPAYDTTLQNCSPIDLDWSILPGPSYGPGAVQADTVLASEIVPGGVTDLGSVSFSLPTTGCIAGLINGMPLFSEQDVEISGAGDLSLQPDASGNFFACEVPAGTYTAAYQFPGDTEAVEAEFEVAAGSITTLALQSLNGQGQGNLTVIVKQYENGPGSAASLVEGALVFLEGTDAASAEGLSAITDAAGVARFTNVDGPFDVTAVNDEFMNGGYVSRELFSAVGLDPAAGQIGIALGFSQPGSQIPAAGGPELESLLEGTVTGLDAGCEVFVTASAREPLGLLPTESSAGVDAQGLYALSAPPISTLDVWFAETCEPLAVVGEEGGTPAALTRIGLARGVAALEFAEERTLDFDLAGASTADLDSTITVDTTAIATQLGKDDYAALHLNVEGPTLGLAQEFTLAQSEPGAGLPADFETVAADAVAFQGLEQVIELDIQSDSSFGQAGRRLFQQRLGSTTPASITPALIEVPSLTGGASNLSATSLNGFQLDYTLDESLTAGAQDGYEMLSMLGYAVGFEGGEGPTTANSGYNGGRSIAWTVALPAGTEGFTFPAYADGLVGLVTDDQTVQGFAFLNGGLSTVRQTSADAVEYGAIFDAAVDQRWNGLLFGFQTAMTATRPFGIQLVEDN